MQTDEIKTCCKAYKYLEYMLNYVNFEEKCKINTHDCYICIVFSKQL